MFDPIRHLVEAGLPCALRPIPPSPMVRVLIRYDGCDRVNDMVHLGFMEDIPRLDGDPFYVHPSHNGVGQYTFQRPGRPIHVPMFIIGLRSRKEIEWIDIAKGIGEALGVKKIINSPTFTIVKEYMGDELKFYHLDLYRLDGLNNDFDLEEYIESEGVCAIEWPHQIDDILPKEYLNIKINRVNENDRIIEIEGIGRYKKYEEMI